MNKLAFYFLGFKFLLESGEFLAKVTFKVNFARFFKVMLFNENQTLSSVTWPRNTFYPCHKYIIIIDVVLNFTNKKAFFSD